MKYVFFTLVLILLSAGHDDAENASTDVIITVDSTNLRFNPSEVTLQEGQAVRFVWGGQALPHNAVAADGLFDSGEPSASENLYCYRIVHTAQQDLINGNSVQIPAARQLIAGVIAEESDLVYMQRLKRSYELANQV